MTTKLTQIKRQCYFYVAWIFTKIVLILPYKFWVNFVAVVIGKIAYYILRKPVNIAKENLKMAFPQKTDKEIVDIVKKIFVHEAKNFFEFLSVPKMSEKYKENLVSFTSEQKNIYNKMLSKKKGLLVVSAHYGNWEFSAMAVARFYPVSVIAKKIYIDGLNNMLVKYRESLKETVILRTETSSARKMIKALKNNEILAMLIDQDTSVQSVFVDFFGKPASTPLAIASLALKLEVPVVVTVDRRLPNGKHTLISTDEVVPDSSTGDFDLDVKNFTQKITKELENIIREVPEQWVWFHERWKTKQQ